MRAEVPLRVYIMLNKNGFHNCAIADATFVATHYNIQLAIKLTELRN